MDGWRRHLALNGKELIDGALERAARIRKRLQHVDGLDVIDESIHETAGVAEWDPVKLSVDVSRLGITGYQAKQWLQTQWHLAAQLGDARRLVFSLTYADDEPALDRLGEALERLAADPPAPDRPSPMVPDLEQLNLEQAMLPREAFFAETEQVRDPLGRVAAEMTSPTRPVWPPSGRAVHRGGRDLPPGGKR